MVRKRDKCVLMRYFKGDAKRFIIEFPLYIIDFRIILSTSPHILSTSSLLLSTKDKTTQTDIHLRHTRQRHTPKQKNRSPLQGSVLPEYHHIPSSFFHDRFDGLHFEICFSSQCFHLLLGRNRIQILKCHEEAVEGAGKLLSVL